MIHIDGAVFIRLAFLLLVLPLDWVVSVLLAALFHEVCHLAVLPAMGGEIRKITVSTQGCVIESGITGNLQAFFSILAGPAGSLLLSLLCFKVPKIAVCGLIHGLYNLLPILPLDGGRLLQLLLQRLIPSRSEEILLWTGRLFGFLLLCLTMYVSEVVSMGIFPRIVVLFWILRMFPRKRPCKASQIKVQ